MASSMSKSKECRKSVYKYLNRIVESGFPSSSVAELHFKLLCSYDLKKAENYIKMNIKNDTLQCNPLDALRCLRSYTNCNPVPQCFLLCKLERWEEAVSLAIEDDRCPFGLWRQIAKTAMQSSTSALIKTSKRASNSTMTQIWLKIAKHEIQALKRSEKTAEILTESEGCITISDVLQYFPQFATIDYFKQALCESLQDVSRTIDEHQSKLEQTQHAAENVRQELKDCQKSVKTITLKQKCHICFEPLLHDAFLSYHCGHHFHVLCGLDEEISFCENGPRKKTLLDLRSEVVKMTSFQANLKGNQSFAERKNIDLERKVMQTIGDECCFCGLRAVNSIGVPLSIGTEDW